MISRVQETEGNKFVDARTSCLFRGRYVVRAHLRPTSAANDTKSLLNHSGCCAHAGGNPFHC